MITNICKTDFSDIYEVRLYSGYEDLVPSMILRKVGTFGLSDSDFIETDFKYKQGKLEFSNPAILDELIDEDKEKMEEKGLGNLEKYLLTLFPTSVFVSPTEEDNISYFSSNLDSTGMETICILVPEDIVRIEMYDVDSVLAIEVQFGVNKEGEEIQEELDCSKVLTLNISYSKPLEDESETKKYYDLNLSWMAYEKDKNPVRKMSEYVLRNDSFSENWKGYYEKYGYIYSNISNSLVGTEKIEKRPIYDLLKEISTHERGWNRSKRYSIGDKVIVGGMEYESLCTNNIGNHPYYSRMWIKS